jgi:hypothetical protein
VDLLLAAIGVLAVLHVAYATWTAKRLDRLHRRLDAAVAALDAQLRQRAGSAETFAAQHRLAPLASVARATAAVGGLGHDREAVENDLSRALQTVGDEADETLVDVTTKTSFARRFHNDAVRDVLEVRTRRIVRWFRLAGHAPLPAYFEIDDTTLDRRTIEV